ncbi:MAG: glycosyltransferase family 32 protein [Cyanobium sp.]
MSRDGHVPDHLTGFRSSWRHWNPNLKVLLWTDASLRDFIAERAPEFLPFFDGVAQGVCRADLGRYLLLLHFGGIYADLDCQCLQPLAPLLQGRELVIAPEPDPHHRQPSVLERGLIRLLCPSFLASVPGHPLWSDVLSALGTFDPASVVSHDDVLDATGPFLLSRVFEAKGHHERQLLSTEMIYPFSKEDCWQGRVFDPQFWSERTRESVVAHYWDGSWFKTAQSWRAGVPAQASAHVQDPPWTVLAAPDVVGRDTGSLDMPPLISCLMVTRGRPLQASRAIECFLSRPTDPRS